ncbi:nucleoside-diphosphate sugar epimerase/dehydratase [Corynebacterium lactis]|uniref:dTDP-glucose 4,6-dehydratase n=1 Tax=Corynebacterium lactis RW2-5 TaxID=1408189 RepID=A0A0K2GXC7_9CORY|nr:nucleoside-diphosphate sugar epimerase/dehydratase [Corynebacterium lactis]ALA66435.1 dTDP-glucose 4,6-dehydratase [Corynebacterium lactis RW2-5]
MKVGEWKQAQWVALDVLAWLIALAAMVGLINDDMVALSNISSTNYIIIGLAILVMVLLGISLGEYSSPQRVWPGSRTEDIVLFILNMAASVTASALTIILVTNPPIEWFIPLAAGICATLFGILARTVARWIATNFRSKHRCERLVILGAGRRAKYFINSLTDAGTSRDNRFQVVAVVDPEQGSVHRFHGLRVVRGIEQLEDVASRTRAESVIIATDEALSTEYINVLNHICEESQLRLLVLPPVEEYSRHRGARTTSQVREINIADLIGRQPLNLDETKVSSFIRGKKVLVTGAGGSIGSEICRQVHRFGPSELIMLDRDEGGLHATQLSLTGTALLDGSDTVLADIRDAETLNQIFAERQPDIVYHAAALKHLPLLESYPAEAVQTNVVGTQNVLNAAARANVCTFINISTDKAANPASILGESKRAAERLTAHMGNEHSGVWASVRFGNVFGSRGSVITTFQRQIEEGGPVTVTHPEVERYFMTIPEASQLVLQATVVAESGETLVLEMGKPVRIADLARNLIKLHDADVDIVYTGLREGEKISEDLVDDREEAAVGDRHPLITEVRVEAEPLDPSIDFYTHDHQGARRWLAEHGGSEQTHAVMSAAVGEQS